MSLLKRIVLGALIVILTLSCNQTLIHRNASASLVAKPDIYAYRIVLMKLPAGSLPPDVQSVKVADSTLVNLKWTQKLITKPFDEQDDPVYPWGQSTVLDTIIIMNSEVTYTDPEASVSDVMVSQKYIPLSDGEYNIMIAGSTYDAVNNVAYWAKLSDPFPFKAYYVADPPVRSINLILEAQ